MLAVREPLAVAPLDLLLPFEGKEHDLPCKPLGGAARAGAEVATSRRFNKRSPIQRVVLKDFYFS
jgi:hypothetical protein